MNSNYDKQLKKQQDWKEIEQNSNRVAFGRVEVIIKDGMIERYEITEQYKSRQTVEKRPELETVRF